VPGRGLVGAVGQRAGAPLHRLLLGRDRRATRSPLPRCRSRPTRRPPPADRLGVADEIAVEPVGPVVAGSWRPGRDLPPPLRRRASPRIDTAWRRTSYSALTAGGSTTLPRVSSEPEAPGAHRRAGERARRAGAGRGRRRR
jgi:exodeoxyribonuclease V beta subunit